MLAAMFSLCVVWALPAQYTSSVTPSVPEYALPVDLAQVEHMQKAVDLTAEAKQALAERGFVVVPDTVEQMFLHYEEYGTYDEAAGPMPNFITVDSVLQAYHVFFNYSLRQTESKFLIKLLTNFTQQFCGQASRTLLAAPVGPVQEAAKRNLSYFLVARSLLTGQEPNIQANVPGKVSIITDAKAEIAKIEAYPGRAQCPILLNNTVHYDQFVPRGHYTRTPALSKYFKTMMWYGLLGFDLDDTGEAPAQDLTLQALLITRGLNQDVWLAEMWDKIYEPTCFFVGAADDLTWRDYLPLAKDVFGQDMSLTKLNDDSLMMEFLDQGRQFIPTPQIAPAFLSVNESAEYEDEDATAQGRQFRMMGQRFIADSWALQQLVYPLVKLNDEGKMRYWPTGLDVGAGVFGSTRARDILFNSLGQNKYENYSEQLRLITDAFDTRTEAEWWSNLYNGWLACLRILDVPKGTGYPTFMQTEAWQDKQLVTSLGSWAQLRHDTILYGKPSGAELGAPEEVMVQGYVEPYPEFYGALAYLTEISREGLSKRGILDAALAEKYNNFYGTLMFLKKCSEKHLRNESLTKQEYEEIQWFGGKLERLNLSLIEGGDRITNWYEITNEADRFMATIADVHTSFDECLEVGVGLANRIYVIVPKPNGGLQLAKGGVLSYHEFKWPVNDRLTDKKWVQMLQDKTAPDMPAWTEKHIVKNGLIPSEEINWSDEGW